ncbi:putative quinol monooxygenase [Streptomyces sp. NPDC048361]|uniref:putative quinol monooxygenase n=1 Tax=Streptomyces sp. NPDC048361 TaxID=3154720 RepID=UPI00341F7EAF
MITCTTVLDVAEGNEEPFEKILNSLVDHVRAHEPGTPVFEFVRHRTTPRRYLVVEQYVDEAALAEHSAKEYLADIVPTMLTYLANPPQLDAYDPVEM